MKKIFLICWVLIALLGLNLSAQSVSDIATAHATILSPLTITKSIDLDFGNITVGTSGGTVLLLTNNTRSATGGVVLPSALPGTISSAKFITGGYPNATYDITLPTSVILTNPGGVTMTATNFTSTPSVTGTLNSGGTEDIYVGATLNVVASQAIGEYSGSFEVSVNYN